MGSVFVFFMAGAAAAGDRISFMVFIAFLFMAGAAGYCMAFMAGATGAADDRVAFMGAFTGAFITFFMAGDRGDKLADSDARESSQQPAHWNQ